MQFTLRPRLCCVWGGMQSARGKREKAPPFVFSGGVAAGGAGLRLQFAAERNANSEMRASGMNRRRKGIRVGYRRRGFSALLDVRKEST